MTDTIKFLTLMNLIYINNNFYIYNFTSLETYSFAQCMRCFIRLVAHWSSISISKSASKIRQQLHLYSRSLFPQRATIFGAAPLAAANLM